MRSLITLLALGAAAFAQPLPSYKDLKYPPLPQVKIPEPATFTLSNGMRLYLLEDHELPLVRGLALIRTGNLFDPPDKRGVSEVMADVMRSGGTKTKTGDQLDEQLENMAASVESSMGESEASMNFSALKENTDAVLGIFKDVLTNPEFRQDKIDLELTQMRSEIARRNDDAGGIPGRELSDILYGRDTPYGWTIEYEHLAHIHREDLIQFYKKYYFPKNVMLAVYGDFNSTEMKDKLEKLFADWTVSQAAVPDFPKVTAKPAPGIYLAEKPDVTQTFFEIGELGGTLRDKDFPALQVAGDILGSGFTSRLMTEIRTHLGYAYNIYATWAAEYDHPGTFRIGGSTKSASTVPAIKAITVELEKLRSAEVTPRELDEAKEGVLNSFVFFFDSPAKTIRRLMFYEYYGYPKDFLSQYQKAIAQVTRADVLRVAKQYFLPENLTIVAAGNSKEFGTPLSELGKVNMIDLTIPEPKEETAKADPASLARGRSLLQKAQAAMGGADKLAEVKDQTEQSEMAVQAGGMKIKQRSRLIWPDQFRQDQELPFGKVSVYTDGKTGWLIGPQGPMAMPAAVMKQAHGELFRQLFNLVMSDRDASRTVNAVSADTVEISRTDGETVRLTFDNATGLPSRESYMQGGMGAAAEIGATFSDWRDVKGLKVPYKTAIEQGGKPYGQVVVESFEFNTGLKAEDLSKKP